MAYPPSLNSSNTVIAAPRTPSPTPSEQKELKTGAIDWRSISNWRFWFRREWLWYYVILTVILVITALVTLYHKQIVDWLTPATKWLHDLKLGWLVPIGVLFVISFPPLFGHEIVAILCGLVWGLWIGFGIVAAGTFLGEVGNFYAFKYCCRSRGEKLERSKISYACLAQVVRDGGFKIALIARLSAIPGHFTTAVFSTCGMNIFVFSIAAILSMPKQFITVYLGVIIEQSNAGVKDTKSRIVSDVVLVVTFIITIVAMWYILRQMNKVKPEIIYRRRKARQVKLNNASLYPATSGGYPPYATDDNIESAIELSPTGGSQSHYAPTAPFDGRRQHLGAGFEAAPWQQQTQQYQRTQAPYGSDVHRQQMQQQSYNQDSGVKIVSPLPVRGVGLGLTGPAGINLGDGGASSGSSPSGYGSTGEGYDYSDKRVDQRRGIPLAKDSADSYENPFADASRQNRQAARPAFVSTTSPPSYDDLMPNHSRPQRTLSSSPEPLDHNTTHAYSPDGLTATASSRGDIVDEDIYLPTPPFGNPAFAKQQQQDDVNQLYGHGRGHVQQATDGTFWTARGSE